MKSLIFITCEIINIHHLCKAVDDADAAPDSAAEDVRDEEVDAPALHATALTHAYSAQRHHQHYRHGNDHRQDGEVDSCIALEIKKKRFSNNEREKRRKKERKKERK